jgi:aminopeptidase N
MPGKNLTRHEAQRRAHLVTVQDYRVTLDLGDAKDLERKTFRSESTIRFTCAQPGASTFLDLIAPSVESVALNGRDLDPADVFADSRVRLDGLAADNEVTVVAQCAYSRTGEGLHRFADPADGEIYLYTQFEPADARRLYANFEQPDLKASFVFDVSVPEGWHLSGNAPVSAESPARDGVVRRLLAPTERISTYITVVVAGPYHVERDHFSGALADGTPIEIPLALLCRASLAAHFDHGALFEVTKQGLGFFHERFDFAYPFGKYDQAFVPEYNLGAMENPGCVTFTEDYVFRAKETDSAYQGRANTILHEMAHMWFGDLVTMRWWDDLWLKESFADFMGSYALAEATRWTDAWVTFANRRKSWAYRQDQLPTTHPIVANINDLEDAKLNFDGITYAKGASVLKQLFAYVGEEAFIEGARRYFKQHAYGNTTLGDLLAALEGTSGRDLGTWSKAWLETAGVNTLFEVEEARGADGGIEITQLPDEASGVLRPHRIVVGCYAEEGGRVERTGGHELDVTGATTRIPGTGGPAPQFVLLNDQDLTYAKVRFGARAAAFLERNLSRFTDPFARSLCWSSLWNTTRDAELPGSAFVAYVDRHAGAESDVGVLANLLGQVGVVLDRYLAPQVRPEAAALAEAAARRELAAAAPGSDHQLAWLRFLAAVAASDEALDQLAGLLSGELELPGLPIDSKLRWLLLTALTSAGRASDEELAAELARDQTAAGRMHYARALAARPTAQAKAEAWHSAVESGDQPGDLIEEALQGMARPDRIDLLRPFVEPYFAMLDTMWAERTIENAARIVLLGFPGLIVEPGTLERADAWLAGDGHVPALRRLVAEARDDLARALRCRDASRQAV